MKTQNSQILSHLKTGASITPMKALVMFNCFRLSARIYDLKEQGFGISGRLITKNGKTFSEYTL